MRKLLVLLFCVIHGLTITGCGLDTAREQAAETVQFVRFDETKAFQTLYPQGWEARIVETGILVFAPVEVMNEDKPGPSLTVYRDAPADSTESLSELMDHFLSNGPIREGYKLVTPINETGINGFQGLMVDFESTAEDNTLKGRIEMVRLDNQAVYYFIASAPQQVWEKEWFFMDQIIRQSIFNES
ncbi:MAG: hypothetical protein JXA25_15135 [Anaerolineales bacterium]|nr:hypothetical protein [Anaerolineales bacterium]